MSTDIHYWPAAFEFTFKGRRYIFRVNSGWYDNNRKCHIQFFDETQTVAALVTVEPQFSDTVLGLAITVDPAGLMSLNDQEELLKTKLSDIINSHFHFWHPAHI